MEAVRRQSLRPTPPARSSQLDARHVQMGRDRPGARGGGGRSRMIPAPFDYVRPADLDGALKILSEREGDAKVLSGGYSLLPLLKRRLAQPALLVDIRDVAGLDGIVETDDELRIGGRATHRQINKHPIMVHPYPFIREVSGGIGDAQVRNWGTIGGSVAHADPASDWPAALLAAHRPTDPPGAA